EERLETVGILHRTELGYIFRSAGHELRAQRIGIADANQRRAEQFRMLSDRSADRYAASAGAFASQVRSRRVFMCDQVSRSGNHVVNRVLLRQLLAADMPVLAIL